MNLKEKQIILLITHKEDFYTVDKVYNWLLERDVLPIRLNTDEFPNDISISSKIDTKYCQSVVKSQDFSFKSNSVRSIWVRKFGIPLISNEIDEGYINTCIQESVETVKGFFASLQEAFWLDPYNNIIKAENKLLQLQTARQSGLTIPKTILTNDPEEVKKFYTYLGGEMVTKLQRPLTISMGAPEVFLYTSVVTKEDIEKIDSLKYCPMIFQEKIPVERELRIIYVGGRFFTGRIVNPCNQNQQPDWRRIENTSSYWAVDEIPKSLQENISRMMHTLGLNYGAIDVIKTNDGQYVFLEVNPSGEWGMLEKYLDLPIAAAIAEVLYNASVGV